MKRMIHFLLPKEKRFFGLLVKQSGIAVNACNELKSFIGEYEKIERSARKEKNQLIKSYRQENEQIANDILLDLNKQRTAIDREDISRLSILLSEIVCLLDDSGSRFIALSIERVDNYTPRLVESISDLLAEINLTMANLDKLKKLEGHYLAIKSLKGKFDNLFDEALSDLFHFYKNSMDILKYREIYGVFHEIAGKCNEISFTTTSVIASHR